MLGVQADEARRQDRSLRSWQPVAEVGGGLVLAVDFGNTQRAQSGFPDLAARLTPTRTVWETMQPPVPAGGPADGSGGGSADGSGGGSADGPAGAEYLAWWLGGLPDGTRPVDAVLGYCVGGVFAAEVHSQVAVHQDKPPLLILFDPEIPTRPSLLRDFDNAVEQLSPMLPSAEPGKLRDAARSALDGCADFREFGVALKRIFRDGVTAAFDGIPVGPKFTAELIGSFDSFINYVMAAHRDAAPEGWATATAIMSRDGQDSAGLPGSKIRFDIGQVDVLRDAEVARAVSGILGSDA